MGFFLLAKKNYFTAFVFNVSFLIFLNDYILYQMV